FGDPYLFDLDSILSCEDGRTDFNLAFGSCSGVTGSFEYALDLAGEVPPFEVCARPAGAAAGGATIRVEDVQLSFVQLRVDRGKTLVTVPFTGRLPSPIDISELQPGDFADLTVQVTDGNTPPVTATNEFISQGETLLVFDAVPIARIAG